MKLQGSRSIDIPTLLKVEKGALDKMGEYIASMGFSNVVLFFGNGLIDMFGSRILESLQNAGVEVISYRELDDVSIEGITSLAFDIPNRAQCVAGIGGGKVIDSAKYMGFLRKIPFLGVPTSASSDGFSSASCSLSVGGRRATVPAAMASAIICDIDVLKTAPVRFIYSGVGDMTAKITSLYDWQFEAAHGVGVVDDVAVMVAKEAVNAFVRTPFETVRDDLFLRELVNSMAMSGIANEIAGGSAPTSGSEHLISHALDKMLPNPQLHGIQVGIACYLMALVQKHRVERINTLFTQTGFWDYVYTLGLNVEDYEKAIDMAPSIKPNRHTFLHEERYREEAKGLLRTDPILKKVFGL